MYTCLLVCLRQLIFVMALLQDWKIYRRRQVFELLASLFSSTRADPSMRRAVLKVSRRACFHVMLHGENSQG